VVRDEEKYEEEKRDMEEKARMAERESRYSALLSKSAARYSGRSVVVLQDCASTGEARACVISRGQGDGQSGEVGVNVRGEGSRHFNVFEMQNEDDYVLRKKEKDKEDRDNVRRRGDPATMTSDARFDQSFRFANNMQELPWYLTAAGVSGADAAMQKREEVPRLEQEQKDSRRQDSLTKDIVKRKNERKAKEKDAVSLKRRKKKSSKRRHEDGGFDREKLRKERLEREQGERQRAKYAINNNNI
jgi:hypothetical protein